MLTIGAAFYRLKNDLQPLYDEREAVAVAHIIMEHITGLGKLQRISHKDDVLSARELEAFANAIQLLVKGTPVQHITGKAWFAGYEFMVNKHVLIPRPETEELVQWIASDNATFSALHILDVGSGSGCIPVMLKKLLPAAAVTSCDVSPNALEVARQNAVHMHVDVTFLHLDFLNEIERAALDKYEVIVSNPPYIPMREMERLHTNVREHEPHLALFVPNDDPLLFYRAIAEFGHTHLLDGGCIYCELDADHAVETKELFLQLGYGNVELRKDIHGNYRMLRARKVF